MTNHHSTLRTMNLDEIEADTRNVLNSRIASGSRDSYDAANIKLIIWLYDFENGMHRNLLQADLLVKMDAAYEKDEASVTKSGKKSKTRNYLRNTCREALHSIVVGDNTTCPIKLEEMSFATIAQYLSTFQKKAKGTESMLRLSTSSYDGARSALAHLYTESGVEQNVNATTKHMWINFTSYKKGVTRIGVKEKMALGISTEEGKRPLPFEAYKLLAQILFESESQEHIAAHLFLLLEWNLMSRAEMVVGASIDVVRCNSDAIQFDIGKTKTDQDGTRNVDHPWHVYSNPHCPQICTFLALARHLINCPKILEGRTVLFEGSDQYDRFNKIFLRIIKKNRARFVSLGMSPEDFGTHSIRKGAVTHTSTGSVACPPIGSICIRANWTLPGVLPRYLKGENAGDQFVGQCVSGRPRLGKEFAASPPYIDFSDCTRADKELHIANIDAWIIARMPPSARDNDKVFMLFKTCLASLYYHREFVNTSLHTNSCLRTNHFMTEEMPFVGNLTVKYPWNATSDTPEVTGMPPDVLILSKFERLQENFDRLQADMAQLKDDISTNFTAILKSELDARDIGGSAYGQVHSMVNKADEMMRKMESMMEEMTRIREPPAAPPGNEEGDEIGGGMGFELNDEYAQLIDGDGDAIIGGEGVTDQQRRERSTALVKKRGYTVGVHHGHITTFPPDWTYPRGMNLLSLIGLWLIGMPSRMIPPMCKVPTNWVVHFDPQGRQKSKMKQVMKLVEYEGMRKGVFDKRWTWDGAKVITLWDAIWDAFHPYMATKTVINREDYGNMDDTTISEHKNRMGQLSWYSIYNKMQGGGLLKGNKVRKRKER